MNQDVIVASYNMACYKNVSPGITLNLATPGYDYIYETLTFLSISYCSYMQYQIYTQEGNHAHIRG